jgi:hypothetical protein
MGFFINLPVLFFFLLILFGISASLFDATIKPLKFSRHSPIVKSALATIKRITVEINVSRQSSTTEYVWTSLEYEYSAEGRIFRDSIMPDEFSMPKFSDLYNRIIDQFPGQIVHVKVPVRMDPSEGVILPKLNKPFETYFTGVAFEGKHFKEESQMEVLYSKADPRFVLVPRFENFNVGTIIAFFGFGAIAAFLVMSALNGESGLPKVSFLKSLLLFCGISILPALSPVKTPFNFLGEAMAKLSDKTKTKFQSVEIVLDQNATEQSVRQTIEKAREQSKAR